VPTVAPEPVKTLIFPVFTKLIPNIHCKRWYYISVYYVIYYNLPL
jgi:hypothetical protein